jgi:hypothetical protein
MDAIFGLREETTPSLTPVAVQAQCHPNHLAAEAATQLSP